MSTPLLITPESSVGQRADGPAGGRALRGGDAGVRGEAPRVRHGGQPVGPGREGLPERPGSPRGALLGSDDNDDDNDDIDEDDDDGGWRRRREKEDAEERRGGWERGREEEARVCRSLGDRRIW